MANVAIHLAPRYDHLRGDIDGVPAPFWKKLSATISPGSHPWRSDLERLTTTPGGTPSWRSDLGIFWTRAE
ncbi:hypothetical protein Pst134EA_017839 [Puccinia striiformis f. sp. tritici]|uniref:uncharacterized protein n=1 Tax=Puccinia striiformis f. sp. tritici TaxID=168172 RepID=UPI002007B948|nr:uncharacterized protein Pst134EA_031755 [Puccinia striiformis f. sp. tritici]XP_047804487.1 hypothetical protein Pst134EA_017839 [Puccinia striiformis f. sp. tritici]KAH9442597.1 hypothetical protein Pst134EA_031755 [Puccinia striiformis f. sp. tritici]KAH9461540.1 hypothetical protein Pst134EA_017839 [Puccinia striiformis f. sp. tritici]